MESEWIASLATDGGGAKMKAGGVTAMVSDGEF